MSRLTRAALLSGVLVFSLVVPVAAQEPIDPPAGFAEVRATFEGMTRAQWEAAGYIANPPACISSPAGGMGIHAMNMALFDAQFPTGAVDAANPPILLVDATQTRVIGLEWETAEAAGAFTIFGQTAPLLAGHPGIPEPHYMLHAYFRPNGQVLFAEFDPQVTCPALPNVAVVTRDRGAAVLAVLGLTLVGLAGVMAARRVRRTRIG
jgi:hypothetical protein